MQYLGNAKVSAVGQGCMGIGGYFSRDNSRDNYFVEMLQEGINLGLTFIDTAEAYGKGHSEELVGVAVKGRRNEVFLATKVSPEHLSYADVLSAAEGSLRRLQTDYIDLFQIHWPNTRIPIEETMSAMDRLVREGMVRNIGVSNFSLQELKEVCGVVSIQVEYNLFDRTIETDIMPYCEKEKITVIAYSPLDKGNLATNKELKVIASKYDKTAAQIALKWLISHPSVIVIPKATSLKHIRENAAIVEFELHTEDFEKIKQLFSQGCVYIPIEQIKADKDGQFTPNPVDLAKSIKKGLKIKPIRVVPIGGGFKLVEGKLRYWAWVIAHEGKLPIPALVRGGCND